MSTSGIRGDRKFLTRTFEDVGVEHIGGATLIRIKTDIIHMLALLALGMGGVRGGRRG